MLHITIISYSVILSGSEERKESNINKAMQFISKFPVLSAGKETARILSDLKYDYEKNGIMLPLADLFIATQAIENNMTLITLDKGFERIEELKKIIL
jgi:predicted nucleic acid-binding protein